jgi:hypothetical protein
VTPSTVTQPDDFFTGVGDGPGVGPATGVRAGDGPPVAVGAGTGDGEAQAGSSVSSRSLNCWGPA